MCFPFDHDQPREVAAQVAVQEDGEVVQKLDWNSEGGLLDGVLLDG